MHIDLTLEKTEGASNPEITGNIGYTKHTTKTNKTKNTTQYVMKTTIVNKHK